MSLGSALLERVSARRSPDGPRPVRDKLRELHQQVESGLRPRQRYTVGDALDDWLSVGQDGLSARTVSLYRDTIAKALREELGFARLTELTAGELAPRSSLRPRRGPDRRYGHAARPGRLHVWRRRLPAG